MIGSEIIQQFVQKTEEDIAASLQRMERIIDHNQWKVIQSFQAHKVSDFHFADSTGYGYNDQGREILDLIYADVFGAEAALVRPHFVSGTHTISTALFGVLRPGDHMLSITGTPYDTLHKVIGEHGDGIGSLRDWGIEVSEVPLNAAEEVDWPAVEKALKPSTKVVAIQRSRGYDWRSSFTIAQIEHIVKQMKALRPDVIIFVDNCYGEFAEKLEPTNVGVDLMAGSLIKNPGGGIVSSGGYIAGRSDLVELASYRLTAPGLGADLGAMLGTTHSIYQGLFLAPHFVGQAIKGSILSSALFEKLGFNTKPKWEEPRTDLIQAIEFSSADHLISFVQSIQQAAAVDAYVAPIPGEMPGYEHPVIMAAGTFIQGGSLELSADAPIREPYIAYMQGGLTYSHVKIALIKAIEQFIANDLVQVEQLS